MPVVNIRKLGELQFRANKCSYGSECPLDDPVWLFSQVGPGTAACCPSVPARLQPKLSAGICTDVHSHFARQGEWDDGEVGQSSILRQVISVNEFLFSCKSCDWLHQTPLADTMWRLQCKKCMLCRAIPALLLSYLQHILCASDLIQPLFDWETPTVQLRNINLYGYLHSSVKYWTPCLLNSMPE